MGKIYWIRDRYEKARFVVNLILCFIFIFLAIILFHMHYITLGIILLVFTFLAYLFANAESHVYVAWAFVISGVGEYLFSNFLIALLLVVIGLASYFVPIINS